ncbi:MAG: methyltransferase domain-containing protein [Betaproteobacteria bacterium]
MAGPDRQFWQDHFDRNELPWDRGAVGPHLQTWLADGTLAADAATATIAVPGCGSGHEVLALAQRGFAVTAIDYAQGACDATRARLEAAGATADIVCADVLDWRPATPLSAVYEQTCLCALHPDHWARYAASLHAWLRPGGRLLVAAMQVDRPGAADGLIEGPPYDVPINALRSLLPEPAWAWPRPPYARQPHRVGAFELGLVLTRR